MNQSIDQSINRSINEHAKLLILNTKLVHQAQPMNDRDSRWMLNEILRDIDVNMALSMSLLLS